MPAGVREEGDWVDGERVMAEGRFDRDPTTGCQVWDSNPAENQIARWTGPCVNGKAQGVGVLTWTWTYDEGKQASERYEGEMRAGKAHGQGTYYTAGGDRLEGSFVEGSLHGLGTIYFGPNSHWAGDRYEGEFRDDRRTGQGTYYYANGNRYVGEFRDDKKSGYGVFTWATGNRYEGTFVDGKKHGVGKCFDKKTENFHSCEMRNDEFVRWLE